MDILKMKNRKGDLREQVPEIVLVVLIIFTFIFGGYKLYQIYSASEIDAAKNILESVVAKINLAKGEDIKDKAVEIPLQGFKGADNWWIVGFSKNDKIKPQKCYRGSCLCICKFENFVNKEYDYFSIIKPEESTIYFFELRGKAIDSCQENGFCKDVEFSKVMTLSEYEFSGTPSPTNKPVKVGAIRLSNSLEYVQVLFHDKGELSVKFSSKKTPDWALNIPQFLFPYVK